MLAQRQLVAGGHATSRGVARAFAPARRSSASSPRTLPQASSTSSSSGQSPSTSRRDALHLGGLLGLSLAFPEVAGAVKGPKGFNPLRDTQDGYTFLYPFGWQELTVDGQDVVYKDVIEPLESVAVNLIDTEKSSIAEFGEANEVALALADKVLTAPSQPVKVVSVTERADESGRQYLEFEFTVDAGNYVRHSLAVVTVGNGKFYTLITGANDRRWGKMKDKLTKIVRSFEVFDRYNS